MLDIAMALVGELAARNVRVVFAESCTGGMVAGELAKVPGVSQWLCGSAVTYRSDTKIHWLDVGEDTLAVHTAVSQEATAEMAEGVLAKTPEASIAAAITGHLGPDAPENLDGIVFTAIAARHDQGIDVHPQGKHRLRANERETRQSEATALLLRQLMDYLK